MSNANVQPMQHRIANTQMGDNVIDKRTGKQEWVESRDVDGKILYSANIKVVVENPTADYVFPQTVEASRIADFKTDKEARGEVLKTANSAYRLIANSIKQFEGTEEMPPATSARYAPVGLRFQGGF